VLPGSIGLVVGLAGGVVLLWALSRAQARHAREAAAQILEETRRDARQIAERAEQDAEAQRRSLEREDEEELAAERQELDDFAAELDERDEVLANREADAGELQAEVEAKEFAVEETTARAERLGAQAREARDALVLQLEENSGKTRDQLLEQIVHDRVSKARLQAQMRLRQVEEEQTTEAAAHAERIVTIAIDRYNGVGHLERIQNAIPIRDRKTLDAFATEGSPALRVFAEEVDCELITDFDAGTATVRGDDPLAREVARRVLRQIANRSIRSPDRVRSIARQVKGEVDREVQNAGRKAVRLLGLRKVHPDVVHLVGRLKYRLSYSQNQWKHAVEVGYLSGLLAAEMGLDVRAARRGGLLHDIGKAMTHDHEGSHAVLGADVARRCGEDELISNAIGAHHNDEPPIGPLAHIVAAADAISGARPGARRESVANYVRRIQEIQEIASRSPAVRRVDVMHAGREVRVIVGGAEQGDIDDTERIGGSTVGDAELHPLAEQIARTLESELTFAGQIRVTVIRESKAVTIAS
jgi:ribonuclease Y